MNRVNVRETKINIFMVKPSGPLTEIHHTTHPAHFSAASPRAESIRLKPVAPYFISHQVSRRTDCITDCPRRSKRFINREGLFIEKSGGGGFCVVTAEACARAGLKVPVLHQAAQQEILRHVFEYSPQPLNPVDLIARKSHVDYAAAIEILAKQDDIDGLIVMPPYGRFKRNTPVEVMEQLLKGCAAIADVPKKYGKPVIGFAMRDYQETATYEILKRGNIPFFESPETCAHAMKALYDYAEYRRRI
jgi:hypothetical protein